MIIKNLCNHDITVKLNNGNVVSFPWYKYGDMLRCIRKLERSKYVEFQDENWYPQKISVYRELITPPILPDKEEWVRYIVNDMVARANPHRNDFYVPAQHKFKMSWAKYYSKECFGLIVNPYYKVWDSRYANKY